MHLLSMAEAAEEAGFDGISLMDHLIQIPQVGREWEDFPEAFSSLAFLAGRTTKLTLGTLVTDVRLRNPALLAKMLATEIDKGLRERFGRAAEAKKHAAESVERGRAYVSAYVEFMHYVERLHGDAAIVRHAEHEAPSGSAHRH